MEIKYFEDCEVGYECITPTRTITEADIVAYAALSSDWSEVHISKQYAEKTVFGERIAHGLLGLTIAAGLGTLGKAEFEHKIAGMCDLGWTWEFRKPIKIGDTVHARFKIARKRETKKPDRGILYISGQLINQKGEVVQEGEHRLMVKKKAK